VSSKAAAAQFWRSVAEGAPLTEIEWLTCTDPEPMIRWLELGRMVTCRQARLFGVACCWRTWHFHSDERIHRIVEVAERYADGLAGAAELHAAHRRSNTLCGKCKPTSDSPIENHVLANAAVAANWVSASNTRFQTDVRVNSLVPGGYSAAAASYIAGAATDTANDDFWPSPSAACEDARTGSTAKPAPTPDRAGGK
jgi:hypothetical protein